MFNDMKIKKYNRFDIIDAPDLTITDILVLQPKDTFSAGEFLHNTESSTVLPRIFDHISHLCDMAAEHHKTQYYDLNGNPKPGVENKITRLLQDEFSFFPQKKPLTIAEFSEIIAHINERAANLPPNIHILFSSFPVISPNNTVYNTVVFLQSGKTPSISQFSKLVASGPDPKYKHSDNSNLPYADYPGIGQFRPTFLTNEEPATQTGVVQCTTMGGASFYCSIELCYEHIGRAGKKFLETTVSTEIASQESIMRETNSPLPLIPMRVSHVVTSNVVMLKPECCMGNTAHADRSTTTFTQINPMLSYNGEQLTQENGEFVIKTPAFGNPLRVIVNEPQRPSLLPEHLRQAIIKHQGKTSHSAALIRNQQLMKLDRQADLDHVRTYIELTKFVLANTSDAAELQDKLIAIFLKCRISLHTIASIELLFASIGKLENDSVNQLFSYIMGPSPLFTLIYNADTEELTQYIEENPGCLSEVSCSNETVLHAAAKTDDLERLQLIINKLGMETLQKLLERVDQDEKTALFVGAESGCLNAVKLLTRYGANTHASIFEGYTLTATDAAAENGYTNVVEFLNNADSIERYTDVVRFEPALDYRTAC